MKEEQGKKTSPAEKLPAGKDDKAPVPGNAALSDADLDNVAAGAGILDGLTSAQQIEARARAADGGGYLYKNKK